MKTYKQFKKKVLHKYDDLFAILFITFITTKVSYYIVKHKIPITANQVTYTRMFLISPLIILFLFLAPLINYKLFYLLALISSYLFLASDWLDGQIARGTGKASSKGAFLDSIADRFSSIIFFIVLFSIGLLYNNIFIFYGSIVLFALKSFHMMIITKLFFYGIEKGKNNKRVFDGKDAFESMGFSKGFSLLEKVGKFLRIKRWNGTLGGAERFFLTIMLPLILLLLGFHFINTIILYILIILFLCFFMIRIKNLFKGLK